MRHSPKNINPKKLTLSEMWEVYQLLRVGDGMTGHWMSDIDQILGGTSPYRMERVLGIMYKDTRRIQDGMLLLLALTRGMRVNNFDVFDSFMKVLRR